MRRNKKWISITHAILKFKTSASNVHSHCKWIQDNLNENRSHLGSRLAKIGTDNDEAVRDILTEQLSQFHHRKDRCPPFNVWSILMISKVWYVWFKSISWHENAICLQSWHQISRKFSGYLDSDAVWVSSQVFITCHDNLIIPHVHEITHNIKFNVSSNKIQDMITTTQT